MRTGTLVLVRPHRTRRSWALLLVELGADLYELEVSPRGVFSILVVDARGRARFEPCPVVR
jgi:hypothetical protein